MAATNGTPPTDRDDFDEIVVSERMAPEDNRAGKEPVSPRQLLYIMKCRQDMFGSPIPEGYVPPPGIDLDALLKQLPPPRPRPTA